MRWDVGSRKLVLFDFDGTIADTLPGITSTARRVLLERGYPEEDLGDLSRLVGPPFPQAFSLVYGVSADEAKAITARYREITITPERRGLTKAQRDFLTAAGLAVNGTVVAQFPTLQERLGAPATGLTNFPVPRPLAPDATLEDFVSSVFATHLLAIATTDLARAGDGNLHPLILFDANNPDELHRCELFGADILETSVAMGGTVTGEHGVGVEKLNSMCTQFTAEENAQMAALKQAFDPAGLLNPGKVVPTLHRCAEYGKMLVRGGRIAHPDLPRF